MKPQLSGATRRASATPHAADDAALLLQEELVAAIYGAFEVAVQIAVGEVKRLLGRNSGDMYEGMRRENESLKQRLHRAEAMLEPASDGSPPPTKRHLDPPDQYGRTRPTLDAGGVHGCEGVRGDAPPARPPPSDPQDRHVSRHEEQRSGGDVASEPQEEERHGGCTERVTEEISRECVVKVETGKQPCQDSTAQDCNVAPLPGNGAKSTLEQVTVKQEMPEEEESDGSACFLDSIKVEEFSLESVLEWETDVPDTLSQDPNTRLPQAHPTNMTTGLPPPTDLPSLSSEFPIFQVAEPAPIPEPRPQIYGVHVRTSHTIGNIYSCKFCGETFHLPSLLRRHHGQCPQRLQQQFQQPGAGSKRNRLQLYPPGCSPFRCTECNREFNRMENLKTHLRIHTGERPYTCSVCFKCFRHSGALTRHFRIHTGEKPYICGQCGKSFRNCGGLKFHQRSHSKQLQLSGTQEF